jgi:hypothetical protein
MKRLSWPLAMLGSLVLIAGCAKQVPSPDLSFDTTQKVVLTFRGGEQVVGKVAPGRKVELREPGVIWRAKVGEITEEKILLKDLTQIRATNSVAAQAAREANAMVFIGETAPDKTFLRSEITKVEMVKFDGGRTAQQSSFWAYGAAVLILLLGERS